MHLFIFNLPDIVVCFCHLSLLPRFFFFFQAEDGIRDIGVTGVQTCALPIFSPPKALLLRRISQRKNGAPISEVTIPNGISCGAMAVRAKRSTHTSRIAPEIAEIGRASCRERV